MITLNNKKFAENEQEFIESVFQPGGSCVGYVKAYKKSVTIMDHNKNKVGVINRHGVLCKANPFEGNAFYNFGDIDIIGRWDSYMKYVDECKAVLDRYGIKSWNEKYYQDEA